MASEAEHLQVVLAVMSTLEYGKLVVDLQGSLATRDPTGLAATAARRDQGAAPSRRERLHRCSPVVSAAHPLSDTTTSHQRRRGIEAVPRASGAQRYQVGGVVGAILPDAEQVE